MTTKAFDNGRELKDKIEAVLRGGTFNSPKVLVDVSDGDDDVIHDLHLVIVSRKFDGLAPEEKRDLIWENLRSQLKRKEWGQVTLVAGHSSDELKSW